MFFLLCLTGIFFQWSSSAAGQQNTPRPNPPAIAPASDEAIQSMQVFQVPDGVEIALFSAEPDVANPVAIDVDRMNRVWVCESFRQENGIEDNRNHAEWLMDDLAARTVADRIAYIRKHLGQNAVDYTRHDDRIRLLVDTDRDGKADRSTVFADRFNAIEQGTGAGVLHWNGDVYYTCIPDLWKLTDRNGDSVADSRKSLHSGFGVRFAFRGHDMHGLIIGPDGRLYFSIGDRGYHVNDQISDPASGAVFRCELDGSDLQVIHTGLRNPQELAFDDYGNLFTGDNNSDSGDKARMVFIVEGGDSGWRMHYQYLPDRGPFNRDKIWQPEPEVAYTNPPIDNFADGPSGFAFYPGTGFGEHMKQRFLLCDFRGQTSGSGIKTFRLEPDGSFFRIVDQENTFWNILATDCCFGPDGKLYVSDWVHGWDGLGKGRIYSFTDRKANSSTVESTQRLLETDFSQIGKSRLATLLGHADRRVRQLAQFELADRKAVSILKGIAKRQASIKDSYGDQGPDNLLSRIHTMWALEQIARRSEPGTAIANDVVNLLKDLCADQNAEIRVQSAKLIGELLKRPDTVVPRGVSSVLSSLIEDESERVRYFAVTSLAKFAGPVTVANAISKVKASSSEPMIRHARVMGLVNHMRHTFDTGWLNDAATSDQQPVRLAAAIACRKLAKSEMSIDPVFARLISDPDPVVSGEAIRAVYDLPVTELLPSIAALEMPEHAYEVQRRILYANFRLGTKECLDRIAKLVSLKGKQHGSSPKHNELARQAVECLSNWNQPRPLDPVLGNYWPIDSAGRYTDLSSTVVGLLNESDNFPAEITKGLLKACINLQISEAKDFLVGMLDNPNDGAARDEAARLLALQAIIAIGDSDLSTVIDKVIQSPDPLLRMEALRFAARKNVADFIAPLSLAIRQGSTAERQSAISILGESSDTEAIAMLTNLIENDFDSINRDAQLDLLLAGKNSKDPKLKRAAENLVQLKTATDEHFQTGLTRFGGNAAAGSKIFYERGDVSCLRCHKIQGSGGDVGPNLSAIGLEKTRDYLLESLIEPSKTIAKGFETLVVVDLDGKLHVGVKKSETKEVVSIMTAEAIIDNIPAENIDEIRGGASAMPDDVTKHLSLPEIRDLIEFLATRKEPDKTLKK